MLHSPASFASLALALALAAPALAGGVPHVGDIGVQFVDGRIVTSLVEEEAAARGTLGLPQRVFDADLGTIEFGPYGNDEPGYTTTVLPVGASIGFNIRSELKTWNGASFDVGVVESLQIAKFLGTPGEIQRSTGAGFVPGYTFATADALGAFDEHNSHILRGAPLGGGLFADPSDGVYLLELELTTDAPGIRASEAFWIVFNLGLDQGVQDAAIAYVEDVLVPGPHSAAGLATLALLAMRRRRGVR